MQNQDEPIAPRPLPTWLSIPIILVCLGGGGWIIHWYVMTDPISHESKILGDAPAVATAGGRNRPAAQRRYVQDRNNGRWDLWTEKAHADLSVIKGKTTMHNVNYMGNYSFVPDDARKTIMAARALAKDTKRLDALKIAPAAARKLEGLSVRPPMIVSPADRDLLGAEVATYAAANEKDRPALEIQLLKMLDDVSDRSIDASRQEAINRAAEINKIVTPQMWSQNAAMGGAGK